MVDFVACVCVVCLAYFASALLCCGCLHYFVGALGGWVCWRCVFVLELIVCLLIVLDTIRLLMVEFTVCCSVVLV